MIIINHSTGHCISIASVSSKWIQTKFFPGSVRGSFCIWIIFEEESDRRELKWNSRNELQCPGVPRNQCPGVRRSPEWDPECSGEEMCPLCKPDFQVAIIIIIRSLSLLMVLVLHPSPSSLTIIYLENMKKKKLYKTNSLRMFKERRSSLCQLNPRPAWECEKETSLSISISASSSPWTNVDMYQCTLGVPCLGVPSVPIHK